MCEATSSEQPNRREVTAADLAVGQVWRFRQGASVKITEIGPRGYVNYTGDDGDGDTYHDCGSWNYNLARWINKDGATLAPQSGGVA